MLKKLFTSFYHYLRACILFVYLARFTSALKLSLATVLSFNEKKKKKKNIKFSTKASRKHVTSLFRLVCTIHFWRPIDSHSTRKVRKLSTIKFDCSCSIAFYWHKCIRLVMGLNREWIRTFTDQISILCISKKKKRKALKMCKTILEDLNFSILLETRILR